MRLVPVVCCLLLVLAGCQSAPAAPEVPTTESTTNAATDATTERSTATTQPPAPSTSTTERVREIDVEGGTLPYDANTVWERVTSTLGVDVSPPVTVSIEDLSSTRIAETSRFQRLLGVDSATASGAKGLATPSGNHVAIDERATEVPGGLEYTLAHEFTHIVQFRTRATNELGSALGVDSRDEGAVGNSLVEGSATYAADQYEQRYATNGSRHLAQWYQNRSSVFRFTVGHYHFGARYVNATVASPAELDRVYENPPRTTEELIHTLSPGSEPPATLSVSVEADRRNQTSGRLGELYVRSLLGTAVNESVAARAADGWGNDRRVAIGSGNETDYAWVHRWDDAANATEFERGVDTYLAARGGLNASVRVERVAPETTVLFVGSESFVADASASGTNESVTVRSS